LKVVSSALYIKATSTGSPSAFLTEQPVGGNINNWSSDFTNFPVYSDGWAKVSPNTYNPRDSTNSICNLAPNTQYRVVSVNTVIDCVTNLSSIQSVAAANFTTNATDPVAPTIQASNLNAEYTTATSAILSWTRGNGEHSALFIVDATGSTNTSFTFPISGDISYYPDYACGEYQSGNIVYSGDKNKIKVRLKAGKKYAFKVIEYNGLSNEYAALQTDGSNVLIYTSIGLPAMPSVDSTFTSVQYSTRKHLYDSRNPLQINCNCKLKTENQQK